MAIKIGIVGVGKIARDQHVPEILASPSFELVATASLQGSVAGINSYSSVERMLNAEPAIQALVLCQPPQYRFDAARVAILAGKHVFLEKPPAASVLEVYSLVMLAKQNQVSLFTAWHSREASGVTPAKAWLKERTIISVQVEWKEDVRHWHAGQDWIWQPGGLGVFDPGVNALSIITHILPRPFFVGSARLFFPLNKKAPIAAQIEFRDTSGVPISAEFDFRQAGPQIWEIMVNSKDGPLILSKGGNQLTIAGKPQILPPESEYRALYEKFYDIISRGSSEVDLAPLKQVADIFLRGDQVAVEDFED